MGLFIKNFTHPVSNKEPSELLANENFILLNPVLHENEVVLNHKAPAFSFFTPLKGSLKITINTRSYRIGVGTFLLTNFQSNVELINETQKTELFIFFFNKEIVENLFQAANTNSKLERHEVVDEGVGLYEYPGELDANIKEELREIVSCIKKNTIGYFSDEFSYLLLEHIINYNLFTSKNIERAPAIKKSTKDELYYRVKKAKRFIEENSIEKRTLKQIAGEVNLNPYHLIRAFKAIFSITPMQYQILVKINNARKLLTTTNLNVSDICFKLGFESISSFSLLFKDKTGLSPTKYRAQHKK